MNLYCHDTIALYQGSLKAVEYVCQLPKKHTGLHCFGTEPTVLWEDTNGINDRYTSPDIKHYAFKDKSGEIRLICITYLLHIYNPLPVEERFKE